MELVLIGIATLMTSGLTLFSGFGLGTTMPVLANCPMTPAYLRIDKGLIIKTGIALLYAAAAR